MTQADRHRLVALKKAKDGKMTQRQAAEELKISERQVRRLLARLRKVGDQAVLHGLRESSNRQLSEEQQQKAVEILKGDVYKGFGPTLASEYLAKKHDIEVSKETVRKWMRAAGLWRPRKQLTEIHQWRERRERFGELVQWDTSTHEWLEGRGERIYLIKMIDDATSRLFARFVRSDSTAENMAVRPFSLIGAGYFRRCLLWSNSQIGTCALRSAVPVDGIALNNIARQVVDDVDTGSLSGVGGDVRR